MRNLTEETDYRSSPRINQSFLKDVIKNFTREDTTNQAMEDGNVVDCLITTPQLFEEKYAVLDIIVPSKQYRETIDLVYANAAFDSLDFYREEIIQTFRSLSGQNWKDDTIFNNVKKEGENYWNSLWKNKGKRILSTNDHERFMSVVNNLLTGKTGHWFEVDGLVEEIEYQKALFFDYELDGHTFECKALLDLLRIDHKNRTVRMLDVKTTQASTKYWPWLAKQMRYEIQASFYQEALKFCYPDYKVLNPIFLVESTTYPGKPRDFVATDFDLLLGKKGAILNRGVLVTSGEGSMMQMNGASITENILGFEDALRILKQSTDFGLHDFDVDYYHHCRNREPYELNVFQ